MDRCEAPFAADLTIHRKDTKNNEARDDYGRWGLMAKVRETPSFVWTSPEGLFGEKPQGDDAAAVLEAAAREAVELAAYQAGEELDSADAGPLADALIERLPGLPDYAYLDETDYTVGRLRELVGWLAVARAGPSPTRTRLTAPW